MNEKTIDSYLTFRLLNDLFAVNVSQVLEIIETGDEHVITNMPKAPETISGVVNFRGNVVPVIDTRKKFDLEPRQAKEKSVIMVFNIPYHETEHIVGAMADKVVDVIEINPSEIRNVPEVGKGIDSHYIEGVLNRNGQFIMLLNIKAVINKDDIIDLKGLSEEAKTDELVVQ